MNENPIPRISSLGGGAAFLPEPSISQLPLPPALSTQPLSSDGKLAGPQTPAPAQALFQESSPASTTSAFLLGIHNYKALEDVDLPKFVKEHQATLTFPEKVRCTTRIETETCCRPIDLMVSEEMGEGARGRETIFESTPPCSRSLADSAYVSALRKPLLVGIDIFGANLSSFCS